MFVLYTPSRHFIYTVEIPYRTVPYCTEAALVMAAFEYLRMYTIKNVQLAIRL